MNSCSSSFQLQIIKKSSSGSKAPTSVKLEPLFFLKTDRDKFDAIESKTNSEILAKIQEFNLEDLEVSVPEVLEV